MRLEWDEIHMNQSLALLYRTAIAVVAAITLFGGAAYGVFQGDCNSNGIVGINEVQRCANIFSDTQAVSSCPQCDFNSSNRVEINEVQGAANCFLDNTTAGCRMLPTPVHTATSTETPAPTDTSTPQPTATAPPPTDTSTPVPTDTPLPPTVTATPQPTDTPPSTDTATPMPTDTPEATFTATAAEPTATATQGTAVCGNNQVEPGETCDDGNTMTGDACPPTCIINNCGSAGSTTPVNVHVQTPQNLRSIQLLLDYPDGTVFITGTGSDANVQMRVTNRPVGFTPTIVDLNYALFAALSSGSFQLTNNQRIFVVNFDRCAGAPLVTPANFTCTVQEAINTSSADITNNVTCSVVVP